MPELPEVESLSREIHSHLSKGHVVVDIIAHRKDLRFPIPIKQLGGLKGQKLVSVGRRAKYLIFNLGDYKLLSHLGMTGGWRFEKDAGKKTHDHFAIRFKNGEYLVYNDPRRFGYIDLVQSGDEKTLQSVSWFKHLGPEPFDEKLKPKWLMERAAGSKRSVKVWLMDQENLVGVGNIYASEVLHFAKINPLRKARQLDLADWQKVLFFTRQILQSAIQSGGTTLRDYRSLTGETGEFQSHLRVYGQCGRLCVACEDKIKMKVVGGRSTYWCPTCQPQKKSGSKIQHAK